MKPKLLVPAPRKDLLEIAFNHGADGGYAPVKGMTNVRFRADHFDGETLTQAFEMAKSHSKLLFPVINGRPNEEELPAYQAMIEFCLVKEFPGVVLGDWGLIKFWSERFRTTKTELIASGMAGVINHEAVSLLRDLGVDRIILPRLQTLPEIKSIVERGGEMSYEIFMNGPLCPLYEGRGCFLRSLFSNYKRGVCFLYPQELNPVKTNDQTFWGIDGIPLLAEKPEKPLPICALSLNFGELNQPLFEMIFQSNLKYLEEIIGLEFEAVKVIPFQPSEESYRSQVTLWRRLIDQVKSGNYQITEEDIRINTTGLEVSYGLLGECGAE